MQVVARRWPLLAVGLAIGGVVAALIHLTATPAYQSNSQLLVTQRRTDILGSGRDVRMGMVEDVVGTQVTVIKSERIRMGAVRQLRNTRLNRPLPADDREAAAVLGTGLNVARDRDTATTGPSTGGIVNLSYRGPDPADTRRILEAVIDSYEDELAATYSQATRDRLATLDNYINTLLAQQKSAREMEIKFRTELTGITTEELSAIRGRVSALKDRKVALETELIDLDEQRKLIAAAGPNLSDRQGILAQLTAQSRLGGSVEATTSTEGMIRRLEAQKTNLSQELGKDSPQIKALDAEIEFHKAELKRQNPGGPTSQLDELAAYGKRADYRYESTKRMIKSIQVRLQDDEQTLQNAGRVQIEIDKLRDQVLQYERRLTEYQTEKTTTQVSQNNSGGYDAKPLAPPGEGAQVSPVLYQSILLGLAFGLLIGSAVVLVAELTDKSFRSPGEIRKRLGLPVIGHIPQIRTAAPPDPSAPPGLDPVLASAVRPKSVEAEAYRGVRTQLYFSTHGQGHRVIQVTSPNPGDGKSTLAANLAVSVAQSGKRVVLVDCDMRKPRIHKLFDLPAADVGLAGVIAGTVPFGAAVLRGPVANLDILPCGPRPQNPAELLTSPEFPQVLEQLRSAYDFVIVDTPPLLAVSDPAVVAPRADGVVVVFRMTKKARPAAERAREQLAALGANVLGVVVNGYSGTARAYDGYNYGSGPGYRYADYQYVDAYSDPEGDER
jgi:capsular exopolysaccharide synthesis family protein